MHGTAIGEWDGSLDSEKGLFSMACVLGNFCLAHGIACIHVLQHALTSYRLPI